MFIVRFLAATLLAADNAIFIDFLRWLQNLLVPGGIPRQALTAGLEALRPEVAAVDAGAALLLDLGRQQLRNGRADPGADSTRRSPASVADRANLGTVEEEGLMADAGPPLDDLGHPVEVDRPVRRVVSLVPSLTESVAVTRAGGPGRGHRLVHPPRGPGRPPRARHQEP